MVVDARAAEIPRHVNFTPVFVLQKPHRIVQADREARREDREGARVHDLIAQRDALARLAEAHVRPAEDVDVPQIVPAARPFEQTDQKQCGENDKSDHSFSKGTSISSSRFSTKRSALRWLLPESTRRWGSTAAASFFTSSGITKSRPSSAAQIWLAR